MKSEEEKGRRQESEQSPGTGRECKKKLQIGGGWVLGTGGWDVKSQNQRIGPEGGKKRILFLDERSQKVLWNQQKCTVARPPQPAEQGKKVEDSMDEVKTTVEGSKDRRRRLRCWGIRRLYL